MPESEPHELPSVKKSRPSTCERHQKHFNLGRSYPILLIMTNNQIEDRFICAAEARTAQQASLGVKVRYEDIGERLMELRKIAWDRYGATALWYVPPHATYSTMDEVANGLRRNGDLEAAYLAAAILKEIKARTGNAA